MSSGKYLRSIAHDLPVMEKWTVLTLLSMATAAISESTIWPTVQHSTQTCSYVLSAFFLSLIPRSVSLSYSNTDVPLSCLTSAVNLIYTHTRLTALYPGLPGSASTRKVKPIWILLKQETVSGSGISWAVCKSAPRSRQITTPKPHHSVLYTSKQISVCVCFSVPCAQSQVFGPNLACGILIRGGSCSYHAMPPIMVVSSWQKQQLWSDLMTGWWILNCQVYCILTYSAFMYIHIYIPGKFSAKNSNTASQPALRFGLHMAWPQRTKVGFVWCQSEFSNRSLAMTCLEAINSD